MKKVSILLASLALTLCMFALPACQSSESDTDQASNQEQSSIDESLIVFGNDQNADTSMKFVNNLGKNIKSVTVSPYGNSNTEASIELTPSDGKVWEGDTTALITFDSSELDVVDRSSSDIILNPQYQIVFSAEDGSVYQVHAVSFTEADKVELCLDSETSLPYLTYSQSGGATASTLESEKAIVEANAQAQAEAEAAAVAAQQAAAEQAAADAAEAEAAAASAAEAQVTQQSSTSTSQSYSYTYADTSSNSSNSASQTEDSCMGSDLVLK